MRIGNRAKLGPSQAFLQIGPSKDAFFVPSLPRRIALPLSHSRFFSVGGALTSGGSHTAECPCPGPRGFRGFRGFAVFGRCVPRQGRGLVWAHGRGTCPELLADPGLPSHPPILPSYPTVCADADVMLVGSRSRVEIPAPAWSKQIKERLNGVAPYRYLCSSVRSHRQLVVFLVVMTSSSLSPSVRQGWGAGTATHDAGGLPQGSSYFLGQRGLGRGTRKTQAEWRGSAGALLNISPPLKRNFHTETPLRNCLVPTFQFQAVWGTIIGS